MTDKLIHSGTFDVENYGDLLFPLIAQKRLPGWSHAHLSPCGSQPPWGNCVSSESLEGMLGQPIQGVVIGGGNIIHPNPSSLALYRESGVQTFGYADLWIGTALAASPELPIVWNAPGVPREIKTEFHDLVRRALNRTSYISVRDEKSRTILQKVVPDADIAVVPDSAWDLPVLWTPEDLDEEFVDLVGGQVNASVPHVAIHVNDRYAKDVTEAELAKVIDDLCGALGATAILIGIGPCHQDDVYAERIAAQMAAPRLVLARPASLKLVCAAVSRSVFYCGSSMHGYVTAASFGVPAIVVAKKTLKFEGLTRFAGAPQTLVGSWKGVMPTFVDLDRAGLAECFVAAQGRATKQLDAHWGEIAKHLRATGGTLEKSRFDAYRADLADAVRRVDERQSSAVSKLARSLKKLSRKLST